MDASLLAKILILKGSLNSELALSAHPKDKEQALAAGADRYVIKFPRPAELAVLINRD